MYEICTMLLKLGVNDWQNEDIRLGQQKREVIHMRDHFKEGVLNKHECIVLINNLRTS